MPSNEFVGEDEEPDPLQWNELSVADGYLRLSLTLQSGQAFRWLRVGLRVHEASPSGVAEEWAGTLGRVLFVLRQAHPAPPRPSPDPVWFRVIRAASDNSPAASPGEHRRESSGENDKAVDTNDGGDNTAGLVDDPFLRAARTALQDYLHADRDFTADYEAFCEADANFRRVFPYFNGLRVLRQCPEEAMFAFICSSNNHIKRISSMVSTLAVEYGGPPIAHYVGRDWHAFPSAETLAERADESTLRSLGFGYRAKFVASTARLLVLQAERGGHACVRDMLLEWRGLPRKETVRKLSAYPGVGRKVAGCIALMSLDQHGEVPVDTHVWRIARRYIPALRVKTLTLRVYEDVGGFFRARFGEDLAGVAHNFLFVGELPAFKKLLPEGVKVFEAEDEVDGGEQGAGGETRGALGDSASSASAAKKKRLNGTEAEN